MQKKVASFMKLKTAEGDRISYTYSEIDNSGVIKSQNNKGNFVVMNEELAGHISAIEKYITDNFLRE